MSQEKPNDTDNDVLDRAISMRLRKLRSLPMDTSGLERAVADEFAGAKQGNRERAWWAGILRPTRAVAASVLVLISIVTVVMLTASSGPAHAEAIQMATMHREVVGGKVPVTRVSSIGEADQALSKQWSGAPELPGMPDDHVMACCLRRIENKKIVCVLLNDGGTPVSMMVADGADVKAARSATTIERDGVKYQVESSGELNMVMAKRGDRWVCLIGERPVERLIALSGGLTF